MFGTELGVKNVENRKFQFSAEKLSYSVYNANNFETTDEIKIQNSNSNIISLENSSTYTNFNNDKLYNQLTAIPMNDEIPKNDSEIITKEANGFFKYNCELENFDLIFCLLDFVSYIIIFIKANRLLKYNYVFRCIKYILHAAIIGIIFGPTINFISYLLLKDQRFRKIIIEIVLNTISCIGVFIIFSWDKIYYIIKKEGNNPMIYFVYKRHEECLVHRSTFCGCKLTMKKEEIEACIFNYIDIYNTCSTLFEIVDGKIRFKKLRKIQKL
ncbi:hypothetical protein PIROE2DRAFT_11296 [Piromyces sp. E2]|nr:hypothetical protein PIROE2DRAFT_11296 [Piromyces sp. E2]|eukprot:OUM62446.1 hypothetical protein PIROE2DRAFT_11296 [Piromyces sp. E2]